MMTPGIHDGVEFDDNKAEMVKPRAIGPATDDATMTTVHPYVVKVVPNRMPPVGTPLLRLTGCDNDVVPLVSVDWGSAPQIALGELTCSNRGDGFPVLNSSLENDSVTAFIGTHPFITGDSIVVSNRQIGDKGQRAQIIGTDETSVTLDWSLSIEWPRDAILLLPGDNHNDVQEKLIFTGIVGPVQPRQFYYDPLSVCAIVDGLSRIIMDPEDIDIFKPGDRVYMGIRMSGTSPAPKYTIRFNTRRFGVLCFVIGTFVNAICPAKAEADIIIHIGDSQRIT